MDRTKILIEWITKRLFPISIVIFILIHLWWFRLTPWNPQEYCCSNRHYQFGLILLLFYFGLGMFWWFTKNRTCLGMFFRLTTIFFFVVSSCFIAIYMPRIIDVARYNGTVYYLVTYSNLPEHPPWDYYQLTKWNGFFNYEIHAQPDDWTWKGKFLYDKKTNLMNIVAVFDDGNPLLYTDDDPPRYYLHSSVQLDKHLYYISSHCILKNYISKDIYFCKNYTYALYECELDNTACAMLPFRYLGKEDYAFIEINEETRYIDLYIDDFLAYSYGEHPRCYAEGCEILEGAK